MYDIIVVGGGPAGLTAALYALRAEKTVLVLERLGIGGQIALSSRVENFPGVKSISGFEFAENLAGQVTDLGGKIKYEDVIAIKDGTVKTVVTDSAEYEAKAVIVATGLKNRTLGVSGEEEMIGSGVSFCAVCDGAFYRGKTVAVIGGGNTAVEDAEYMSGIAEKVYIIHRRDKFRAEERLVKRLEKGRNVEFVLNATVEKFCGEGKISGLDLVSTKDGTKRHIDVDGAFIAVGQIPQNDVLKGLIELSDEGYVASGEDCLTNVKGIFVAGDCRKKTIRQLTTAVGDGSVAALAACSFVDEE